MPLVRISLMRGNPAGFAQKIGAIVYRTMARRLHRDLGVPLEDGSISLVEVKKENWSFGDGVAQ
jgi:phenylpyruvate tautomerase PptA (4-oxalocrotonate tautomerase family)